MPLTHALERAINEPGRVMRVDWELTDGSGRLRYAESAITNLLGDPHVRGLVVNTRDATDQVVLQRQLTGSRRFTTRSPASPTARC